MKKVMLVVVVLLVGVLLFLWIKGAGEDLRLDKLVGILDL